MSEEPTPQRLGPLIFRVGALQHRRIHDLLDGLGLYRGQDFVLRALWKQDGMAQSELTELLDRCPAAITKTIQRMEKAGFVERRSDAHDERVSRVYLTDAGRNVQSAVESALHAFDERAFAGFSKEELTILHDLLLRVCTNIEDKS